MQPKAETQDKIYDLRESNKVSSNGRLACQKITQQDIQEIKAFPKPVPSLEVVMKAVMILTQDGKYTGWSQVKKTLSEPRFVTYIQNYNVDVVPRSVRMKLR